MPVKKKHKPTKAKAEDLGLAGAFALALQPNYLGSPEVVTSLVSRIFEAAVNWHAQRASIEESEEVIAQVATAFSCDDAGYTRMPGWHTSDMLGNEVIKFFDLDEDYYKGENLFDILAEGLCGVLHHIAQMLNAYGEDPKANWDAHALPQLNGLFSFVVAVLLGTNSTTHPGKSMKDFVWVPVA